MSTTHHTVEDIAIMRVLPNMTVYSPADGPTAVWVAKAQCGMDGPSYVRLDRGGVPDLYAIDMNWDAGVCMACPGMGTTIISTGMMVHTALKAADRMERGMVIDVHRLKPLNSSLLLGLLGGCDKVVTLEEHQINGGLGGAVAEMFADYDVKLPLLRLAVPDRFSFELGGREEIHKACGLDVASVVKRINEWGPGAAGGG